MGEWLSLGFQAVASCERNLESDRPRLGASPDFVCSYGEVIHVLRVLTCKMQLTPLVMPPAEEVSYEMDYMGTN